jgi:hypothetical protein
MESGPDAPLQPPRHELIEFDGDRLVAVVLEGDGVAVPVRVMCESIGLDTETQVGQLRTHPVLSAGLRVVNVAMGGRIRSVVALIHHRIPFWLATISPNLVNEATRPKLVRYQEELADILARLFYGEAASPTALSANPEIAALQRQLDATVLDMRRIREALIAEQQRLSTTVHDTQQQLTSLSEIVTELETVIPIVPAQAEYIQRTLKRLAKRLYQQRAKDPSYRQTEENLYQLLFGQFKVDMRIPRYDALPRRDYDRALGWLQEKARTLLPDDPEALPPHQEQLF